MKIQEENGVQQKQTFLGTTEAAGVIGDNVPTKHKLLRRFP